jgi:hypothetical protein
MTPYIINFIFLTKTGKIPGLADKIPGRTFALEKMCTGPDTIFFYGVMKGAPVCKGQNDKLVTSVPDSPAKRFNGDRPFVGWIIK